MRLFWSKDTGPFFGCQRQLGPGEEGSASGADLRGCGHIMPFQLPSGEQGLTDGLQELPRFLGTDPASGQEVRTRAGGGGGGQNGGGCDTVDCPLCSAQVWLLLGPHGVYVQLGPKQEAGSGRAGGTKQPKPRTASVSPRLFPGPAAASERNHCCSVGPKVRPAGRCYARAGAWSARLPKVAWPGGA